jgi:hypothetical protein
MRLQRIIAQLYEQSIEGVVVDGTPLEESDDAFDLDSEFTLLCDDGALVKVCGWAVDVTVVEA